MKNADNDIEEGIEFGTIMMEFEVEQQQQQQQQQKQQRKFLHEHIAAKPPNDLNNIRVNVGIDKDLEMILEMDPSIIDLVGVADTCTKLKSTNCTNAASLPPIKGGPTFKTVTPTSRTHLKLQLQREQQQQELERQMLQLQQQQNEQQQLLTTINSSNSSLSSYEQNPSSYINNDIAQQIQQHEQDQQQQQQQQQPLQQQPSSIGVDVPPQVLQVRTVLENPTRYHVMQKQKNQVRQYLSESFKQQVDWRNVETTNPLFQQQQQQTVLGKGKSQTESFSAPSNQQMGVDDMEYMGGHQTSQSQHQYHGQQKFHHRTAAAGSSSGGGGGGGSSGSGLLGMRSLSSGKNSSPLLSAPISPSMSSIATSNSDVSIQTKASNES